MNSMQPKKISDWFWVPILFGIGAAASYQITLTVNEVKNNRIDNDILIERINKLEKQSEHLRSRLDLQAIALMSIGNKENPDNPHKKFKAANSNK